MTVDTESTVEISTPKPTAAEEAQNVWKAFRQESPWMKSLSAENEQEPSSTLSRSEAKSCSIEDMSAWPSPGESGLPRRSSSAIPDVRERNAENHKRRTFGKKKGFLLH